MEYKSILKDKRGMGIGDIYPIVITIAIVGILIATLLMVFSAWQGATNTLSTTVSNETSRAARVRVRSTADLGVEQDFQLAGTNLVADISETAVAYSGGRLLAAVALAPGGESEINLQELQVAVPPSLHLVVTVERDATGGSNTNFDTSLIWYEDL